MFPYWLLFSVFAAGSLEYRRRGLIGSQAAPLLALAGLATALIIGLRFEVGGDWFNYTEIYDYVSDLSFGSVLQLSDPGYALLNWFSKRIGFGIWFVNLICAFVFCWGLFKFARRQPNPWLVFVVAVPYLIIVVAMGYTRQGVAIGFILAGLAVVDRTSLLRFTIYILFAAAFHKSAVIVLPLVALAATHKRFVNLGLLMLTAVLVYYLFVSQSMDRLMSSYVEAEFNSQGAAIRVAMNLPPATIFLIFQRRFQLAEEQRKLWRNFSLAAFVALFFLLFLESSTAVDRLALYLIPLQMFVLSRIPEAFPDRRRVNAQILLAIIAYSAAIQFIWLNFATHAEFWLPYRWYLYSD